MMVMPYDIITYLVFLGIIGHGSTLNTHTEIYPLIISIQYFEFPSIRKSWH
jgi:hypothetical protein